LLNILSLPKIITPTIFLSKFKAIPLISLEKIINSPDLTFFKPIILATPSFTDKTTPILSNFLLLLSLILE